MEQPNESSPEFSPSILHNKKGPMNPSFGPSYPFNNNTSNYNNNNTNSFQRLIRNNFGALLTDKRALALVCLMLPPLAVFWKTGLSRKFGLSLILFAFFVFPGTGILFRCSLLIIFRNSLRFLCQFFRVSTGPFFRFKF